MKTRLPTLLVLALLAPPAAAGPYCASPALGSTDPNCAADAAHGVARAAAEDPEASLLGARYVVRPMLSLDPAEQITDMVVDGGDRVVLGTNLGALYVLQGGAFVKAAGFTVPAGQGIRDISYGGGRWYIVADNSAVGIANQQGNNALQGSNVPEGLRRGSLVTSSDLVTFRTTVVRTMARTNPTAVQPLPDASGVSVAMNNSLFARFDAPGTVQQTVHYGAGCVPVPRGIVNAVTLQLYLCYNQNFVRAYNPAAGTFAVASNMGSATRLISRLKSGRILAFSAANRLEIEEDTPGHLAFRPFAMPAELGEGHTAADDGADTIAVSTTEGLAIRRDGSWSLIRARTAFTEAVMTVAHSDALGFLWAVGNRVFRVVPAEGLGPTAAAAGLGPQYTQVLQTLVQQRDGVCPTNPPSPNTADFDCHWKYLKLHDPRTYVVLDGACTNGLQDVDCYVQQVNGIYGQAGAIAGGDLSSLRPHFGAGPGANNNTKTLYYGGNAAVSVAEAAMRTENLGDAAAYLTGVGDPLWAGYDDVVDVHYNPGGPLADTLFNAGKSGATLTRGAAGAAGAAQDAAECVASAYAGGECPE